MDQSSEIFKLNTIISRLHKLAVVNLETVMNLTVALSDDPTLGEQAKQAVGKAAISIDEQIKTLEEIERLRNIGKDEP